MKSNESNESKMAFGKYHCGNALLINTETNSLVQIIPYLRTYSTSSSTQWSPAYVEQHKDKNYMRIITHNSKIIFKTVTNELRKFLTSANIQENGKMLDKYFNTVPSGHTDEYYCSIDFSSENSTFILTMVEKPINVDFRGWKPIQINTRLPSIQESSQESSQ